MGQRAQCGVSLKTRSHIDASPNCTISQLVYAIRGNKPVINLGIGKLGALMLEGHRKSRTRHVGSSSG